MNRHGIPSTQAKLPRFGSRSSTEPRKSAFMLSINRRCVQVTLNPPEVRGRRMRGIPTVNGVCTCDEPFKARIAVFSQVYEPLISSQRSGRARAENSRPWAREFARLAEVKELRFWKEPPRVTI